MLVVADEGELTALCFDHTRKQSSALRQQIEAYLQLDLQKLSKWTLQDYCKERGESE